MDNEHISFSAFCNIASSSSADLYSRCCSPKQQLIWTSSSSASCGPLYENFYKSTIIVILSLYNNSGTWAQAWDAGRQNWPAGTMWWTAACWSSPAAPCGCSGWPGSHQPANSQPRAQQISRNSARFSVYFKFNKSSLGKKSFPPPCPGPLIDWFF